MNENLALLVAACTLAGCTPKLEKPCNETVLLGKQQNRVDQISYTDSFGHSVILFDLDKDGKVDGMQVDSPNLSFYVSDKHQHFFDYTHQVSKMNTYQIDATQKVWDATKAYESAFGKK